MNKLLVISCFLFGSLICEGQITVRNAVLKFAKLGQPIASAGDTQAIITANITGSTQNNPGGFGFKFTVGSSDIVVTSLMRWNKAGNADTHTVRLINSSCVDITTASINTTLGTPGTWQTVSITPTTLTHGQTYYVMSDEDGVDVYYIHCAATWTGDITGVTSTFNTGGGCTDDTANEVHVPVNFLYHVGSAPSGWALIGTGVAAASADSINVVSPTYNTTGASAVMVMVTSIGSSPTPTSVPVNTWVKVVEQLVSFGGEVCTEWQCLSPTTSSVMTVTITGGNQPSIGVMAFSGGVGTVDKTSGGFAASSPVSTGSITPTSNSQLLITGVAAKYGVPTSVDSGFNTPLTVTGSSGLNVGLGMSYLVQNPAAPINATWTTSSADLVCTISSHVQ